MSSRIRAVTSGRASFSARFIIVFFCLYELICHIHTLYICMIFSCCFWLSKVKTDGEMMKNRRANSPNLELSLNLSPPRSSSLGAVVESPLSHSSPCLSCGLKEATKTNSFGYSSSLESTSTLLVLAGCPRCLMYVMLSEVNPKCPRCKSTVLLDFLSGDHHRAKKLMN